MAHSKTAMPVHTTVKIVKADGASVEVERLAGVAASAAMRVVR
jgi:hypothetical protein